MCFYGTPHNKLGVLRRFRGVYDMLLGSLHLENVQEVNRVDIEKLLGDKAGEYEATFTALKQEVMDEDRKHVDAMFT